MRRLCFALLVLLAGAEARAQSPQLWSHPQDAAGCPIGTPCYLKNLPSPSPSFAGAPVINTGHTTGSFPGANGSGLLQDIACGGSNYLPMWTGSAWTCTAASGISISGPAGANAFFDAGGHIAGDATNWSWDPTNFRAGIRVAAPQFQLHLVDQSGAADRGITIGTHAASDNGAGLRFQKSRGTFASPAAVTTADYLSRAAIDAYDGTSYIRTVQYGAHVWPSGTVATGSVPSAFFINVARAGAGDPYGSNAILPFQVLDSGSTAGGRVQIGLHANDTLSTNIPFWVATAGGSSTGVVATFEGAGSNGVQINLSNDVGRTLGAARLLVSPSTIVRTNPPGPGPEAFEIYSRLLGGGSNTSHGGVYIGGGSQWNLAVISPTASYSAAWLSTPTTAGPGTITELAFLNDSGVGSRASILYSGSGSSGFNTANSLAMYNPIGALQFWASPTGQFYGSTPVVALSLPLIGAGNLGSVVQGGSVATGATDGFIYISSSAGAPTGTPTSQGNSLPVEIDRTNNTFNYYSGGAWRTVTPSAVYLGDPGAPGIVIRTTLNTTLARTLTSSGASIVVTNGTGVSGNPNVDVNLDGVTINQGGGGVVQVADNGISNAKIRQSGPLALVGRSANSTGNVADIQATAASGCAYRESGSTLGCGTLATAAYSASSVTYAKIQNETNGTILGNSGASPAAPAEITIGSHCSLSGGVLDCTGTGGVASLAATDPATVSASTGAVTVGVKIDNLTNTLNGGGGVQRGHISGGGLDVPAGSNTATISGLTLSQLANISGDTILANLTASPAAPAAISIGSTPGMLGVNPTTHAFSVFSATAQRIALGGTSGQLTDDPHITFNGANPGLSSIQEIQMYNDATGSSGLTGLVLGLSAGAREAFVGEVAAGWSAGGSLSAGDVVVEANKSSGNQLAIGNFAGGLICLYTGSSRTCRIQIAGAGGVTVSGTLTVGTLTNGLTKTTSGLFANASSADIVAAISWPTGVLEGSGGALTSFSAASGNLAFGAASGGGLSQSANLNYASSTLTVTGTAPLVIGNGVTSIKTSLRDPDNVANYAQTYFYPASGTNVGEAISIVPKGTGFSSTNLTQFNLFNTDSIADSTNYEWAGFRAAGTQMILGTGHVGSKADRPLMLASGWFSTGTTNANQLLLDTNGDVDAVSLAAAGIMKAVTVTPSVGPTSGKLAIASAADIAAAQVWPGAGQVLSSGGTATAPVGDPNITINTSTHGLILASTASITIGNLSDVLLGTTVAGRLQSTFVAAPLSYGSGTLGISDFVASGASHARGTVPDPGSAAGANRFLREDATWDRPPLAMWYEVRNNSSSWTGISELVPEGGAWDLATSPFGQEYPSGAHADVSLLLNVFSNSCTGSWSVTVQKNGISTSATLTVLCGFNGVVSVGPISAGAPTSTDTYGLLWNTNGATISGTSLYQVQATILLQ